MLLTPVDKKRNYPTDLLGKHLHHLPVLFTAIAGRHPSQGVLFLATKLCSSMLPFKSHYASDLGYIFRK